MRFAQLGACETTDGARFTGIIKRGFDEDTRIYLGEESGGPPGYNNGDFLRQWGLSRAWPVDTNWRGARIIPGIFYDNLQDDGVGFDPQEEYPGHLGLHTMRERVTRLDGTLDIESAPGQGTTVRACLPL